MSLKGKYALVTGGASGIGLECVQLFLEEGVQRCAVLDINLSMENTLKSELTKTYGEGRIVFKICDISDKNEFENVFKEIFKSFGKLDIAVNCAGIARENDWEKIYQINLIGTVFGTKLAMKYMGKDNGGSGGSVVNIASILGLDDTYLLPVYSSSKSGVISFTRSMGTPFYHERCNVRVMAVCPGVTDTPLHTGISEGQPQIISSNLSAFKIYGEPQEPIHVARLVVFLINHGENGSVWVSENGEPAYEVDFPKRNERIKKKDSE